MIRVLLFVLAGGAATVLLCYIGVLLYVGVARRDYLNARRRR